VTNDERDRHSFKVPSLRNVELTAPYLHDGSVTSLRETVRVMAHYQLGTEIDDVQTDRIVAFLRTLTGTYEGRPLQAQPAR
jgi:cytochrome c peroxidase